VYNCSTICRRDIPFVFNNQQNTYNCAACTIICILLSVPQFCFVLFCFVFNFAHSYVCFNVLICFITSAHWQLQTDVYKTLCTEFHPFQLLSHATGLAPHHYILQYCYTWFLKLTHSQINKYPTFEHFIWVIWLSLMLAMYGTHFSYFHFANTYTTNSTVLSSKVNSYLNNRKIKNYRTYSFTIINLPLVHILRQFIPYFSSANFNIIF
jgi:hypothetical protein